jgi:RimJ/RimL family protein N-acetyltransferase
VIIRLASVADAAPIAEVHACCWQFAYAYIFGADRLADIDVAERADRWRSRLQEPTQTTFLAEDSGEVIGFCTVSEDRSGSIDTELWGLYLLPDAWGSGIARALMSAGLAKLQGAGYTEAVSWVLEDNPRARRFYEREGWTEDGGSRVGTHLEVETRELRYRRPLNAVSKET